MTKNPHPIRFALLLGMMSALGPLTIDMYLPAFPALATDYDTSASLVQFSLTACLLGLGVGQLFTGPLSDVKGRRKPVLLFIFFYMLASVACAFAPTIEWFIAGRFLQGLAASAGIVISRAIVRDVYHGKELTTYFSLLVLVGNLVPILAPMFGSGVLLYTDWQGIFLVLSVLALLLLIVVTLRLEETLPQERRVPANLGQTFRNFGDLLRDREFAGYALTQGLMIAGVFAYVAGTPFVYQSIYGASPQLFSILFGMNGIGLIIGSQMVGRLAHRISELTFMKTGLMIAGVSSGLMLVAVLLHGPLFMIVVPMFFFVGSIGMVATSSFALAMATKSHVAGSASALLGLLPFALGSVVSPLVGIAGESTAVPMGAVIFGTSLLALFAFYGLARPGSRSISAD
ncbi:Bcr/CflA family multidrug efflux MFS transporter [Paenibacillus daejeonensis]|uniref:Bcr/CflA family multidrug efflux MFS transporter n=1 Tax=Paenibacillus daejeonensis TaxID=135193 RepID=UPI00036C4BEE|nr:Bcr/CflA family multidrug efflux MFS transporter [Paenibacillus daejeonensis]